MRWYKADLHIHSVLSPCGGLEMAPRAVMQRAREEQQEIIAITDHNSMANCQAYAQVAAEFGIICWYGVEVQSMEEIHVIGLFDEWQDAAAFDAALYASLLPVDNDPDFFGDQVVIAADESIVRFEERALINSSMWSFDEVMQQIAAFGGFAFPAHVDAATFSVLAQLGFLPDELPIPAVGITAKGDIDAILMQHPQLQGRVMLRSSDAHYLPEIGSGYTRLSLETPTVSSLKSLCVAGDLSKIEPRR
jgi:PHP family Zn ribbon phosphoesterase